MDDATVTRKGLLSLGALSASALALGVRNARSANLPPDSLRARIDIHGHAITASIETALAGRGERLFEGRQLPTWDPASALQYLDRQRIDLQLLSTPDPGL
jgi:hypothetical protein